MFIDFTKMCPKNVVFKKTKMRIHTWVVTVTTVSAGVVVDGVVVVDDIEGSQIVNRQAVVPQWEKNIYMNLFIDKSYYQSQ